MKILVVDNEASVRETLLLLLRQISDSEHMIEFAEGVDNAILKLQHFSPDVVLLDVEMDDGTGFDLLQKITMPDFSVIFITAHDKYAIDAFRVSAIDYLLKPVDPDLLREALDKARIKIHSADLQVQLTILQEKIARKNIQENKIVLRDLNTVHFVKTDEILYCEAEGNYTRFKIVNNKTIIVSRNLKEYQSILEQYGFIRCHHGFLVNAHRIRKIDKTDGGSFILDDDSVVPVSQRKREWVMDMLLQQKVKIE